MRLPIAIGMGLAVLALLGAAEAPAPQEPSTSVPQEFQTAPWPADLRLLYESDTRAYYRPCGCNANSAGGLARRAALFADLRAQATPVLVCTAGDFFGTADVFNESKSRFVARMMGELGYDAIGLGEMDLNFGLPTLVADVRDHELPVVCANLVAGERLRVTGPAAKTAERLGTAFAPYRIVTKAGTRVGFVGLISPAVREPSKSENEAPAYQIEDPLEVAKEVVPELRGACDILVVLGHMGEDEAAALVKAVPGIDLVVLGHDPQGRPIAPKKIDSTLVLRATSQGQNIGDLSVKLGPDRRIADTFNRLHVMGASYRDDPAMAKRVEVFDDENRKLQKELFAKQQVQGDSPESSNSRYLGIGACQSCHAEEFEVYARTRHAHAYATLASQFVHRDTNCVGCHVTGFGEPGGFEGVRVRGASVDLIDVQCEACHGPGVNHARDGSYREMAIQSCTKCHTPNDDPDFDFATDWPKIQH
ncbi:MAG TPA: multiheme c-type cytochrome [Candidatus Krumholzibacteria bacterium]|nr:multiheme c-type cytochrome [Candidatus Krumholzibacteria bacterium]